MIDDQWFHGKLLLFGEYSVLLDSMALSVPFQKVKGRFGFNKNVLQKVSIDSNSELKKYLKYLKSNSTIFESFLNLSNLENDINSGLFFDSSIPVSYGVGSSGALCAAIYKRYGKYDKSDQLDLPGLKKKFSMLESGFHGKSSGLDPLISYLDEPLLILGRNKITVTKLQLDELLKCGTVFLIDTKQKGDTAPLVNDFLKQCESSDYQKQISEQLIPITNQCINAFCDNDFDSFFKAIKSLSNFQYQNFKSKIPSDFHKLWKTGLDSNKFWLKLCGSGGGGYLLGFTQSIGETENLLSEMGFSCEQVSFNSM
jgi:mevalonate kinase